MPGRADLLRMIQGNINAGYERRLGNKAASDAPTVYVAAPERDTGTAGMRNAQRSLLALIQSSINSSYTDSVQSVAQRRNRTTLRRDLPSRREPAPQFDWGQLFQRNMRLGPLHNFRGRRFFHLR